MKLLVRKKAAEHLAERTGLPFTEQTLSNLAAGGTGPAYSYLGGRAVYEPKILDEWVATRLAARNPSARRRDRMPVPA